MEINKSLPRALSVFELLKEKENALVNENKNGRHRQLGWPGA
jgi:hypothetical protein